MKILLLQTGSVSAKLSDRLIDEFALRGHEVHDYMTYEANYIYNKLSGKQKYKHFSVDEETVEYRDTCKVRHISETEWADACLVAPADFNTVGKIWNGIADNFVTSCVAAFVGTGKPVYIADAMNSNMFSNPIYQRNRSMLDGIGNVHFIQPTVKALACGATGVGALADIKTIANIVEGHVWSQPVARKDWTPIEQDFCYREDYRTLREYLPRFGEPGYFGAQRKHDRHKGVDIYCKEGSSVYAVEDGEVVDSYQYTGEAAGCGWWNDTWCIKVEGKSGVVTYGELRMPSVASVEYPAIGSKVTAGTLIGQVGRVLAEGKERHDIRNHSTSMLHMELRTESCHIDGWKLDEQRDRRLLDPLPYLLDKRIATNDPIRQIRL